MKKIISFSLWGDNPRYTLGAIRNCELALKIYPDWICRFHVGLSTPKDIIDCLDDFPNSEILMKEDEGNWTGMFWRFEDASDPTVDVMISRDCDSRLTLREKNAVDEWLNSGEYFHIMRDNIAHATQILGGMWGVRDGFLKNIHNMIEEYSKGNFWQVDQNFLREKIYPIVKDNCYVHSELVKMMGENSFSFSDERDPQHFIGQAYDGNDKILDQDDYFIDRLYESTH